MLAFTLGSSRSRFAFAVLSVVPISVGVRLTAQAEVEASVARFRTEVRPLFDKFCYRCHGEAKQKGDIRLDNLNPDIVHGGEIEGWHTALDMLNSGDMPPYDEDLQPTDAQRKLMAAWVQESLALATRFREPPKRTVLRRLTKAQYTQSLQDLLGLRIDFGRVLPDDAKSELGFTNSGEVLQSSPLHLEYYEQVARRALREAVFEQRPPATRYRVRFGRGIGKGLAAGRTGGYQSVILPTDDFVVEILDAHGEPKVGADQAQRKALDALRRKISIGLRGSSQDRFRVVPEGLLLFSAVPHKEKTPKSWQGPSPNAKLELQRCFPDRGMLAMRVTASRGYVPATQEQVLVEVEEGAARVTMRDGKLVAPEGALILAATKSDQRKNMVVEGGVLRPKEVPKPCIARFPIRIPADGFYQVDLVHPAATADAMASVRLRVDRNQIDLRPEVLTKAGSEQITPLGVAALRAGNHQLRVGGPFFVGFRQVVVSPLPDQHPMVRRLLAMSEQRNQKLQHLVPSLRAFVGTRTDDGMDYATFDGVREVDAPLGRPRTYSFFSRLENLPVPEPESGDTEILSGILLIGVWNDHLVKSSKRIGPPLLVESIEVEAPYFAEWPPASHRAILFPSPFRADEERYTRAVLERFMARAFRHSVTAREVDRYLGFWRSMREGASSYEDSIREALVAVLCSPRFLFLAEPCDAGDAPGDGGSEVSEAALASRLSYFLWNSPPDLELSRLAAEGALKANLFDQVDRMLDDPRLDRFVRAFGREWLRMDRLENIAVNVDRHPAFTRFVKRDMAEETYHFLRHALQRDLRLSVLIDSDFAMLNQNLAEFYGIRGVEGPEFRPVEVSPELGRGGLLSQGAFLTGHSDGTWPHPIKRAVWLKEKLLDDPPPPPPPNVPDLDPDTPGFEKLTLKQQLEQHRDKSSCRDCHRRIDPYGVVFERYNAIGRLEPKRRGQWIDASSRMPDGTAIDGVDELKAWLLGEKRDAFAASVIKHLFAYALGRDTGYSDEAELAGLLEQVKIGGYRMRSVVRAIVASPSFQGSPAHR